MFKSSITKVFKPGHKALVGYITTGYPSVELTIKAATVLAENGCDILELGIPFSDPLADGATIQKASHEALTNGITPQLCLQIAKDISERLTIPLVFMTYYNLVLKYGLEDFCHSCVHAGVSGLIIPDLPPEEGKDLEAITRQNDIDLIYLLSPASTGLRITTVVDRSRGFIYLVSLAGVTGTRQTLSPELGSFVKRVRTKTKKPLCVGFGISTPEQAVQAAQQADGVIIGSKLIQLMEADSSLASLKYFTVGVRRALNTMKNTGGI
jgi:tryptophan synthase alpha chain